MKILVTGAEGFIGNFISNILEDFERYYYYNNIMDFDVKKVYFLQSKTVSEYSNENFDYIFHCSVVGGRSYDSNNEEVYDKNLELFDLVSSMNFNKLIHFTSGADFCRSREINNFLPIEVLKSNPIDYFGKSKNQISKIIINKSLGLNIRVFNVYGNLNFKRFQFIDNTIKSVLTNKEIIIDQDRFFDFFLIDDLKSVISAIISGELNEDYNLSYQKKIKVSQIANEIIQFTNSKSLIHVRKEGLSYTGSNVFLINDIENADPIIKLNKFLTKLFIK